MASVRECRRQAAECKRSSKATGQANVRAITLSMAKSWTALANQLERLQEADPAEATWLGRAR
jgi:hypothetical protein